MLSDYEKYRREKMLLLSKEELVKIIKEKEEQIKQLDDGINDLFRQMAVLKQQLKAYEEKEKQIMSGYNPEDTWVDKIVFALEKLAKPSKSSQIIALLEKHDSGFKNYNDKAKSFSANLTKAVKYGRVAAKKVKGVRGNYYFLPTDPV